MYLTTADYVVTVTMLVIPLGIGFFYAWKDSKKASRDEYLLAGRRMNVLPVSLSMFVTYQSALSLLGHTSDFYRFGPMIIVFQLGVSLACLLSSYVTMVPLMYPLQLTSIYDYLEMRYQSKALRTFSTVVGMLQTFFYMVMALLAPGLGLQAAAGIPLWVSVVAVGSIGTVYTAIGGIKSVIWTDVFQTLILIGGLFMLIIRGIVVIGGADKAWSVAEQGGRTNFGVVSPDPRTRHTWWSMIIGAMFMWQTNVFSQANIQRVSAMKSQTAAKAAYILNTPLNMLYGLLLGGVGLVVYGYFYTARCDPFQGGLISNINQISLYFMLHVLHDFPGLSGFYMATIFSGALSTLSSGMNALTANTVEDILAGWLRGMSERKIVLVAKVLAFAYGFVIIGVAYLFKSVDGPINQIATILTGGFGSVVIGIFLMGCTVPWANKYGAFVGGFLTLVLNIWIATGNHLYGRKNRPLPTPPTDHCSSFTNASTVTYSSSSPSWTSRNTSVPTLQTVTDAEGDYEYGFFLYDISYEWYCFIAIVMGSVFILVISRLTSGQVKTKTEARLILPILRKFWHLDDVPVTNESQTRSVHLYT